MTPKTAYFSAFTPYELIAGYGGIAVQIEPVCVEENADMAEIHPLKKENLVEAVRQSGLDSAFFVYTREAKREAWEELKDELEFCYLLDLPRKNDPKPVSTMAQELLEFGNAYREYTGNRFSYARFRRAFRPTDVTESALPPHGTADFLRREDVKLSMQERYKVVVKRMLGWYAEYLLQRHEYLEKINADLLSVQRSRDSIWK